MRMIDLMTLVFLVGGASAFAAWALYIFVLDTPPRRRRIARHLLILGYAYRDAVSDRGKDRHAIFLQLAAHASSRERFASCYAVFVLGWLTRELPDAPDTSAAVTIISGQLASKDPFVRHAAAEALFLIGTLARSAVTALEEAKVKFPNESTGVLAGRALEKMDLPQ
jgi:hypothetical protein